MVDDAMRNTHIYPDKALGCATARYLVQDQVTTFDVVRALSDRGRRGLPCDRSRRSGANQTKSSETTPGLKPLMGLTVRIGNATCRHRLLAITGFGRQNS